MSLDYSYVTTLAASHPAWRLLRMRNAPLVVSFLHKTYLEPNRRLLPADHFRSLLEDELYSLRELDAESFPNDAAGYLTDWLSDGILRRTWAVSSDEELIDLTPATEKAIQWILSLRERSFVGTESRLLTFVRLAREMAEESDPDQQKRLASLHRQQAELESKIERVKRGEVDVLSEFEVRDRFQQLEQLGRELLADFREVEENFRKLSRSARERIALWEGSKGNLLDDLWQTNDEIKESDQGRSFEAFHSFLLHVDSREELASNLSAAIELPAIRNQMRDARLDRVHYDWIDAGEATHKTIASLSQQLRRFLDDQALLENRRIMELFRGIEAHAIALRNAPPQEGLAFMDDMRCSIHLPMDRPLFRPTIKVAILDTKLEDGRAESQADALYSQTVVDRTQILSHIAGTLEEHGTVTLRELTELQPITRGLAEVVSYLDLASSRFESERLEFLDDSITWSRVEDGDQIDRAAKMSRLLIRERRA